MRSLGKALRRRRESTGMSLAQVSDLCGLDAVAIWRIEQGRTDPRLVSQLVPLVTALGLDLPDLIRSLTTTRKKGKSHDTGNQAAG